MLTKLKELIMEGERLQQVLQSCHDEVINFPTPQTFSDEWELTSAIMMLDKAIEDVVKYKDKIYSYLYTLTSVVITVIVVICLIILS